MSPRKRKKAQPDFPATEPVAIREPLGQLMAAREAEELVEPDAPMPQPESFVERFAPRKREPDEQLPFYSGESVRVSKDPERWKDLPRSFSIEISRPLTNQTRDGQTMYVSSDWYRKLTGYGFDDISDKGDGSLWMADVPQLMEGRPETLKILMERLNGLGPQLDGKFERLAGGQGPRR